MLRPPGPETFANRGELEARKNLGIQASGEDAEADELAPGDVEQVDSDYDPGMYTVADVQAYIDEHPEEEDAILEAERSGKNRTGLVG